MTSLPYLSYETADQCDAVVIWLHGLGADGQDFYEIVPMLALPKKAAIRFVFPHAPVQAVTINAGMKMRAWYDIYGIGPNYPEDAQGIARSADAVAALMKTQLDAGITSDRLVLAGFSQGGAMALYVTLTYHQPLAGVLALSCYLPLADQLSTRINPANQNTPILMMHGDSDPVVPIDFAQQSMQHLIAQGCPVQWQQYPMAHGVHPDQCVHIGQWLVKRFGIAD